MNTFYVHDIVQAEAHDIAHRDHEDRIYHCLHLNLTDRDGRITEIRIFSDQPLILEDTP